MEYLIRYRPLHFIAVESHPERSDPSHTLTWRIESDVGEFLSDLQGRLQSPTESTWSRSLLRNSKGIERIIQDDLDDSGTLHEIRIARSVSQTIFKDHGLFLGNSMPIRDMDMFSDSAGRVVRVGTNRGASGIDGNIASAAGFARGLNHPTTLIIGDLAFIHDVNSLSILKRMDQPVMIILINNRGGGIFSFLPIADFKDVFEPYFVTPHDYSFEHAASLFHIPYHQPRDFEAFIQNYQTALKGQASVIIEARVDRDENKRFHQNLYQKIISFLEAL
jgi:2-succinyl-5-enolpyruvyl-6-hydroxy-3-cyclohexene-1-carboxylate synthase